MKIYWISYLPEKSTNIKISFYSLTRAITTTKVNITIQYAKFMSYLTDIVTVNSSNMTKSAIAYPQLVRKLTTAVGDLVKNMSWPQPK